MKDKTYNGYKNYETWCVSLWLDNDRYMYEAFKENIKNMDVHELADIIKEYVNEFNPLVNEDTIYNTLLQGAIDKIDYYKIAQIFYKVK